MLTLRRNFAPWRIRRINNPFDTFFNELAPFDRNEGIFNPNLDVSENDNAYTVSIELPGLDEEAINVSLEKNVLTISGEKKDETEDKGENYHRIERRYGSFKRSVALPAAIEADNIDATFKNGVLTVVLPKSAEAQAKKIAVKAS